ncbi:hypothetical protein BDV96DRAFT_677044 [Lophiotrema nucula]|uniref:Uncharacterized protein n=1 Tax=Lophiotrema nucula TaxID=690887 RepID=A0A6A5YFU8_9PLEO|nr:hypothetical protein BDV96DRAFT_677044 [Lophiotrema nucula]
MKLILTLLLSITGLISALPNAVPLGLEFWAAQDCAACNEHYHDCVKRLHNAPGSDLQCRTETCYLFLDGSSGEWCADYEGSARMSADMLPVGAEADAARQHGIDER